MYLILPTQEAKERNQEEAIKRNCKGYTVYWWHMIDGDNLTALDVEDGKGLTDDEKKECVKELPEDFIKNWN